MNTTTTSSNVNPTATLYRATARFHERSSLALVLYGKVHEANAARAIAYICRMRADRMEHAAA